MKITNDLFKLYKELITQTFTYKDLYGEEELTLFTPGIGKEYKNKLLIVGRAVNGWRIYIDKTNEKNKDSVLSEVRKRFNEDDLQWVIDCWGNNEVNYNTKKSAFWRLAKRLAYELIEPSETVINEIVWTNLYKISKYAQGNPSDSLMNVEFEPCKKILFKEIDYFKPKIILFLTGWSWANPFLCELKNIKEEDVSQYIEFIGKLDDALIVVSQHPQGKPEDEHLDEILKAIKSYK